MKQKIAIMLASLSIVLCLAGCNARNERTVSNSSNGQISDSTSNSGDRNKTGRNSNSNDFMDNMENAASNAGRAIDDAGRAIGDAVTGQDMTDGTGMTGRR